MLNGNAARGVLDGTRAAYWQTKAQLKTIVLVCNFYLRSVTPVKYIKIVLLLITMQPHYPDVVLQILALHSWFLCLA